MARLNIADPRNPLVKKLLKDELPKMQPSALKHEYLGSVANVLNEPAHREEQPDGSAHLIGWGDPPHRTLPLMLIQEAPPDNTVRHAFVPNIHDKSDKILIDKLVDEEYRWTTARGAKPRDIRQQLRNRSRGDVNQHGLNRYEPRVPLNDQDIADLQNFRWYKTRFMPTRDEIDHHGAPEMDHPDDDTIDREKIETNLAEAANQNALVSKNPNVPPLARVSRIRIKKVSREKKLSEILAVDSIKMEPDLDGFDSY